MFQFSVDKLPFGMRGALGALQDEQTAAARQQEALQQQQIANAFARESNPLQLQQAQNALMQQGVNLSQAEKLNPLLIEKQRLSNQMAQNPLYGLMKRAGTLGDVAGLAYLQENPALLAQEAKDQQGFLDLARRGVESGITSRESLAENRMWRSLPADDRANIIARGRAIGLSPEETARQISSGATIADLEQLSGGRERKLPSYAPTKSSITAMQKRSIAERELSSLNERISGAMAPYSRKVAGFSPAQIADAISGENPEQQARYLAARALQPEMASMRLRAAAGNVGITAIEEMMNKSLGESQIFESLVSPEVYDKMQGYINDWTLDAVRSANEALLSGETQAKSPQKSQQKTSITQEDIAYTAKRKGKTEEEVRRILQARGLL